MNSLNLPLLKNIAGKQGKNQEHDHDEKRPGAKELLSTGFGRFCNQTISDSDPGSKKGRHPYHRQDLTLNPRLFL